MNINFSIQLIDTEGNPAVFNGSKVPILLKDILKRELLLDKTTIPDRIWRFEEWAKLLHVSGMLNLMEADKRILIDFIVSNGEMNVLQKTQLLKLIESKNRET